MFMDLNEVWMSAFIAWHMKTVSSCWVLESLHENTQVRGAQQQEGAGYARAAVVVARHGGPREHGRGCLALRVRGQRDGADGGCDLDESQRIAQSILGGIEPLVGGEIRAVEENGDERALLVTGQRLGADALVRAPLVDNAVNLELPVPLKQKFI